MNQFQDFNGGRWIRWLGLESFHRAARRAEKREIEAWGPSRNRLVRQSVAFDLDVVSKHRRMSDRQARRLQTEICGDSFEEMVLNGRKADS